MNISLQLNAKDRLKKLIKQLLPALGSCLLLLGLVSNAGAYHYPWDQGHDTTDYPDPDEPGPCADGFCECDTCNDGSTSSPVYTSTGDFIWSDVDVLLSGRPGIGISRTFNSNDPRTSIFGKGWSFTSDKSMLRTVKAAELGAGLADQIEYVLRFPNGKRYRFVVESDGSITPPPGMFSTVIPLANGGVRKEELDGSVEIYGARGELLQEIDKNGNTLDFEYNAATGQLQRTYDSAGRFLTFEYGSFGFVTEIRDHTNRLWRYSHDVTGNLTSVTDPLGGILTYEYGEYIPEGDRQSYSQLTRITDESGVVVSDVVYSGRQVSSYTDMADTFSYRYFPSSNLTRKTDSQGASWSYSYNEDGIITRITDPDGYNTTFERDENGLLTRLVEPAGDTDTFTYDNLGRQITATNAIGATTTIEYVGESSWPSRVVSESGRVIVFEVDAVGNTLSVTDPDNFKRSMTYSATGEILTDTDALGNQTTYTYDARGQLSSTTDALGVSDTIERDDRGNVTRAVDRNGRVYTAVFDDLDRVIKSTDPDGFETQYEYDAASRILRIVNAAGEALSYEYDQYGRQSKHTDYDGDVTTFSYRSDNLLASVDYPSGKRYTASYAADGNLISETIGSLTTSYSYDPNDRLVTANNESDSISYSYDLEGRLLSESTNTGTVSYTYNIENEVVSIVSGSFDQKMQHNARGLVTQLTTPDGLFDFTYDGAMRRTQMGYPGSGQVDYSYDAIHRLTQQQYAGNFQADYQYGYDAVGNIVSWLGDGAAKSYSYDDRDQLVSMTDGSGLESFAYDAMGNRTDASQSYNDINEMVSDADTDYAYDAEGNLVSAQSRLDSTATTYEWNDRDQLTKLTRVDSLGQPVETIEYAYGPLGRVVSRIRDGVPEYYQFAGSDRITTLDANFFPVQYFYHGPGVDEPLSLSENGVTHFYHSDYLGSIRALSNDTGVSARYDYSAYGSPEILQGADIGNPYLFTAREYEGDGLYQYRSRFYDSGQSRFLSRDPAGIYDGLNYYRYVRSNPTNLTDPSGEVAPALIAAGGAVARCMTECAAFNIAVASITGCGGLGLPSCALECANPMNWFPTKWAKRLAKLKKLKKAKKAKSIPKKRPTEGIYEFPDAANGNKPYVGQSSNIPNRLKQHEKAGRLNSGTEKTTEVLGGKTSREIAEHKRIQELTGGVPARHSPNVSNKVDPIGPKRHHLLD